MEVTDSHLIERSLAGDLSAFDALMLRYERLVYKVAITYCGERESALDITQNAFLKAYENLPALRTDGKLKPWLARIASHESINWLRKNRRRNDAVEWNDDAPIPALSPSQEDTLLKRESDAILSGRLRCLNPKHRLIVSLRYFEEMSIAEIATTVRCSQGLVKNILFRSLRRLKKELQQTR